MLKINMLSSAEKVKGQGVGSFYREFINLLNRDKARTFQISENKNIQADITHYHTIDFKFYLSTFSKKRGVKVCHVHFLPETLDESLKLPFLIKKIFFAYVIAYYKRMDWLVVVNPAFIPELEKYGIKKEKIKYIPNFVSKTDFYPMSPEEKSKLRKTYGISKDSFVVIGVGQVQYRKGILDFIATAKKLPQMHFIWVGGFSFGKITSGYEELNKIYKNPPENVTFTGIVERPTVNQYYNISDVLFLPSYNELFPMAILEAMDIELPILVRSLDLYSAILDSCYLEGSTVEEFTAVLERLSSDANEYLKAKEMSIQGSENYSEEKVWEIWKDFYNKITD